MIDIIPFMLSLSKHVPTSCGGLLFFQSHDSRHQALG